MRKDSQSFSADYNTNLNNIRNFLKNDDSIIYRSLENKVNICIIYVDGMINDNLINSNLIHPLMYDLNFTKGIEIINYLSNKLLPISNITRSKNAYEVTDQILMGHVAVVIEGIKEMLVIDATGYENRSIEEPIFEKVVRGPRESFTENLVTNVTMIRKRVIDHHLKFKYMKVGQYTKTMICIAYHEGLVDKNILNTLIQRIKEHNPLDVIGSEDIKKGLDEKKRTIFDTVGSTERPDYAVRKILDGKITIIVNGSPFALVIPYLFREYFETAEDFYVGQMQGKRNITLRYLAFFIAVSLPAIYVCLISYHQELIPLKVLLSIAAAHRGVPLPTYLEVLVLLFVFDILREGGSRLPTTLGTTVTFIGAIVLGEAAVIAKFVSLPMVIIVSFTGLNNFLLPKFSSTINIIRIALLFFSVLLGLYGYMFGIIGLAIHLLSLKSFGINFID